MSILTCRTGEELAGLARNGITRIEHEKARVKTTRKDTAKGVRTAAAVRTGRERGREKPQVKNTRDEAVAGNTFRN